MEFCFFFGGGGQNIFVFEGEGGCPIRGEWGYISKGKVSSFSSHFPIWNFKNSRMFACGNPHFQYWWYHIFRLSLRWMQGFNESMINQCISRKDSNCKPKFTNICYIYIAKHIQFLHDMIYTYYYDTVIVIMKTN